jgi:hypothetical protein
VQGALQRSVAEQAKLLSDGSNSAFVTEARRDQKPDFGPQHFIDGGKVNTA